MTGKKIEAFIKRNAKYNNTYANIINLLEYISKKADELTKENDRLKVENKELTILCDMQDKNILEQKAELDTLCKRLKGMKKALFKQQSYTAELQAKLEQKKEFLISLDKDIDKAILLYDAEIKQVKSETIKEFAARLKEQLKGSFYEVLDTNCKIDNLVIEMTEGSE